MALQYASLGLRVFPIRGKAGPPKDWPGIATANEEGVVALWDRLPHENVAVKCGPESRLVDLNANGPAGKRTCSPSCSAASRP